MTFFDIQGYEPARLRGLPAITVAHGARLRALTGHRLRRAWLLWDLTDDEWFADAPVLLDFGHEQVEVDHQKFDDLSLTWNTIDPVRRPAWTYGDRGHPDDHVFRFVWRHDANAELAALQGARLDAVELLEWAGGDMADGMVAVSLVFAEGRVTVSNALDENGLEFGGPSSGYRVHRLG
ncbi:hypothetical protein [Lentzea sp.]|uniref:hypothetical protein n=1 Tax=Lentzea sp. TaxID=56099 RepID=UPI002ED2387D